MQRGFGTSVNQDSFSAYTNSKMPALQVSSMILSPEDRDPLSCDLCVTNVGECLRCVHLDNCAQGYRSLDQQTAPSVMDTPLPARNDEAFYASDNRGDKIRAAVKHRVERSAVARREKAIARLVAAYKSGNPTMWYFANGNGQTWWTAYEVFGQAKNRHKEITAQNASCEKDLETATEKERMMLMKALFSGDPESWYFKTYRPEKWDTAVRKVKRLKKKVSESC